jgi:cysteine desulfurase
MTDNRVYLDHNATTPLRPAAVEAMTAALTVTGNPSSVHAEGRAARAAIDKARAQIAKAVGGEAKNVIFTSGATEALNTLLRSSPAVTWRSGATRSERLLVLATEHSAALKGGSFAAEAVDLIPVDGNGIVDLSWLAARLTALAVDGFAPVTVTVHAANSETGVIQPIQDVARIVKRFGAILVCDAVAAIGKIPLDVAAIGADAIIMSAHKFGGPQGVGAIVLSGDHVFIQEPLLRGGGQERRLRSGTENMPGITAMGAAIQEATADIAAYSAKTSMLRDKMLAAFRAKRPDLVVFGEASPRLPNTLHIGLPGQRAETTVIAFDLAGVAVSAGAACASGKITRSHVLDAMGVAPALAESALRFSLGWTTTEADIAKAIEAFTKIAARNAEQPSVAA